MRRPFFAAPSPFLWTAFAIFAAILFLLNQVVTVVPYPNRARDKLLWDLACGGSAFLFVALACHAELRQKRIRERRRSGHCTSCGYDLRASTGRCPECGASHDK